MSPTDAAYEVFCREYCKHQTTERGFDACASCPVHKITAGVPWYAFPDYLPDPGTVCLLVTFDGSKTGYRVALYGEHADGQNAFMEPVYGRRGPRIYPSAWQPIASPVGFLQKSKRR